MQSARNAWHANIKQLRKKSDIDSGILGYNNRNKRIIKGHNVTKDVGEYVENRVGNVLINGSKQSFPFRHKTLIDCNFNIYINIKYLLVLDHLFWSNQKKRL